MNERKLGSVAGATVIAATLAAGSASNAGAVQIAVDELGRTVLLEAPSEFRTAMDETERWRDHATRDYGGEEFAGFGCVNNGSCRA